MEAAQGGTAIASSNGRDGWHIVALAKEVRRRGCIPGRGHSLVFDSGWREVADVVLDWVGQHETSPAR